VIVCIVLAQLAGCGSSKEPVVYNPGELEMVQSRVSDTQDAMADPERFRALFIPSSAPDEKRIGEYKKYSFYAKSALVTGDSAVAEVEALDPQSGESRGTVQWKLKRVDGKWLISDAPLPGGG
jgi:hypothetical protein